MSIRIIAAVSDVGLVASPPSAEQGREAAFAAAWAECDVAAMRAEAGGHATEAETVSTHEKHSECLGESDDDDQTVSPETSADQDLDLTTTSVESVTVASRSPAWPNLLDVQLETAPSLQAPQEHPFIGASHPTLPNDQIRDVAEFFVEQDAPAASGLQATDIFQRESTAHEIMRPDLLTISGPQSADEYRFVEAPIEPSPADSNRIQGRVVSATPHTNQNVPATHATPNPETKSEGILPIEQMPAMTAWQNAAGADMHAKVEPGTVRAAQTTSMPHLSTVAMDITPSTNTDKVLTSGQFSLELDTYLSRVFYTATGVENGLSGGSAAKWVADQAPVDSAYMPLPVPTREQIKNQPAPHSNMVKAQGVSASTMATFQATQSTAIRDASNSTVDNQRKAEQDPSPNGLAHSFTSTLQSEIPRVELGARYSLPKSVLANTEDASHGPLDLTEISALVQNTERSAEGGNSAAVMPPSSTSHSPATPTPPRQVASAIIESASSRGETELVLSPEELGTVRFTISQNDNSLTVTITVDRADTLQLLRRNVDVLTAELSQAGISGASINFGDSNRDRRATPSASSGGSAKDHDNSYSEPAPKVRPTQPRGHAGRLDLRL